MQNSLIPLIAKTCAFSKTVTQSGASRMAMQTNKNLRWVVAVIKRPRCWEHAKIWIPLGARRCFICVDFWADISCQFRIYNERNGNGDGKTALRPSSDLTLYSYGPNYVWGKGVRDNICKCIETPDVNFSRQVCCPALMFLTVTKKLALMSEATNRDITGVSSHKSLVHEFLNKCANAYSWKAVKLHIAVFVGWSPDEIQVIAGDTYV